MATGFLKVPCSSNGVQVGMEAKHLTPPVADARVPAGDGEVEETRLLDPKSFVITSGILTSVWLRRRSSLPANQALCSGTHGGASAEWPSSTDHFLFQIRVVTLV